MGVASTMADYTLEGMHFQSFSEDLLDLAIQQERGRDLAIQREQAGPGKLAYRHISLEILRILV